MDLYSEEVINFRSSNGQNIIYGKILAPNKKNKIKGIVQILHGMCEHIGRYDEFARFLVERGYVVAAHDHAGHGLSVKEESERGFFGLTDGYLNLIEDAHLMHKIVNKRYKNLPYFLLGHSMGSFVARCYAIKYGNEINGLLLSGTMGPQKLVDVGIQLTDNIIQKKGPMYRSRKINSLAFEFANIEFEPVKTKFDWTCSDEEVVLKNLNDPKTNFIFTATGFRDLFNLVKSCNDEKNIKNMPKNLPIYIFSGSEDPVGDNGEGVKKVYNMLKKVGCKDVTLRIYDGYRHEMLNEKNKNEVLNDLLDWIEIVRFGEE